MCACVCMRESERKRLKVLRATGHFPCNVRSFPFSPSNSKMSRVFFLNSSRLTERLYVCPLRFVVRWKRKRLLKHGKKKRAKGLKKSCRMVFFSFSLSSLCLSVTHTHTHTHARTHTHTHTHTHTLTDTHVHTLHTKREQKAPREERERKRLVCVCERASVDGFHGQS